MAVGEREEVGGLGVVGRDELFVVVDTEEIGVG